MENPERKKKNETQRHRQLRIIGGGNIGALVVCGGAMAIAGLVAGFAIKGWFGRSKKDSAVKKKKKKKIENVEEEQGRVGLNDSNTNAKQTQIDLVSALLGEKPKGKDDGANTIAPQDIVPLINYAIPAPIDIVDSDIQEVIPFTKLKPELMADIVEECKSMAIEKPDPSMPLKGPLERLILKPVMSQLTLEAEALLSPNHDHNLEDEAEYEADEEEEEEESVDEKVSEETGISSSAIWPGEMIEELSRELKGMMIDLEEEDTLKKKKNKIMNSNKNEECNEKGVDATNEAVPVAVAKTAKLGGSSSWVRVSVLVTLLLLLLIFHFDTMFLDR